MEREVIIEKIFEILKQMEITSISDNDFALNPDFGNSFFPSGSKICSTLKHIDNIDIFFSGLEKVINEFEKFLKSGKKVDFEVNFDSFLKKIKLSETVISTISKRLNLDFSFEVFEMPTLTKHSYFTVDGLFQNKALELLIVIKKLVSKLYNFVTINGFYNDSYKKLQVKNINFDNLTDPLKVLDKYIDDVNKFLTKDYKLDIFSDGTKEIKSMASKIVTYIVALRNLLNPTEKYKFTDKNNNIYFSLGEYFNPILQKHYEAINELIKNNSTYEEFDDDDLVILLDEFSRILGKEFIDFESKEDTSKSIAEAKLNKLIGLESVKETLKKVIKFSKLNEGKKDLNLNFAFYGNPGTGKTEVARIVARILYENGILPTDKLVEVDRSALVGEYVGETPIKTEAKILEAMGGVLFIDEAYSLIPDNFSSDYGYEAVAKLIKMMEDYRGKFCVILAGYKNPLKKMIQSNPGFKSRILFHLDFENYSREQIDQILTLMAHKEGYILSAEASDLILDIVDSFRVDPNFANAREVRNVLEQVILNQTFRVAEDNNHCIEIEDVKKYIEDNRISISFKKSNIKLAKESAEDKLNNLVGLDNIKKTIKKIRAYSKKNKDSSNFNLHMTFNGKPGTGKTEVARIVSTLLYEAGVLSEAKLIETDANSLISNHIGETGSRTQKVIDDAQGGVLFIDEAYALCQTPVGDEAITVLLKNMEDLRGKFCCILAGYKKEMDELLATNPGFKSRIQFQLDFKDYTHEELYQIAKIMVEKAGYVADDIVFELITEVCDIERNNADFSNARTVRNIIDQVIMNQNLRTEDLENNNKITKEDIDEYIDEQGIELNFNDKTVSEAINIQKEFNALSKRKLDKETITEEYIEQSIISIFGDDGEATGFIISPDGLCLTCNHCISDNFTKQKARLKVNILNNQFINLYSDFEVIVRDEINDIAIIKLNKSDIKFNYLNLEDISNLNLHHLNEFVMVGYPFGGERFSNVSFTEGKIASVNYVDGRKVVFADMFGQPGNSGSPVIDKNTKNVIGIFWGGIKFNGETLKCFTPIDLVYALINR